MNIHEVAWEVVVLGSLWDVIYRFRIDDNNGADFIALRLCLLSKVSVGYCAC